MLSPASATLSSSSLLPSSFNMSMTRVSCHVLPTDILGWWDEAQQFTQIQNRTKRCPPFWTHKLNQIGSKMSSSLSLYFWWCGELGTLELSHKMEEHGQGNQWDTKLNEGYPSPWLTMARNVCIRLHMYHVYPCLLICIIQ
jgi:hypothetical protein